MVAWCQPGAPHDLVDAVGHNVRELLGVRVRSVLKDGSEGQLVLAHPIQDHLNVVGQGSCSNKKEISYLNRLTLFPVYSFKYI